VLMIELYDSDLRLLHLLLLLLHMHTTASSEQLCPDLGFLFPSVLSSLFFWSKRDSVYPPLGCLLLPLRFCFYLFFSFVLFLGVFDYPGKCSWSLL